MPQQTYDVVIVGGGHNGLTAAAYLSRAGLSVLLLERSGHLGGASVSAEAFPGMGARLSRYSYLVSLLPRQIIDDLGLRITLRRRRYSSYTPQPGTERGLLIDHGDPQATRASFEGLGAGADIEGWDRLYARTSRLAQALWPTVTGPLPRRRDVDALVGDSSITRDFLERPLGEVIETSVADDLVRGVVLTDGLISTYASAHDVDLQQNVCFLYHVIGGGTGDWDVPVGGMGAVSGALEEAAHRGGAQLCTDSEVTSLGDGSVTWRNAAGDESSAAARQVLWAAAPGVLDRVMGNEPEQRAEGAQVKVNLLLSRLPRLRDATVPSDAAFGGTFHINETYTQLETAYRAALSGALPQPVPAEIYCHSITDPSILSPQLQESGAHTLTVFALQTPDRLLDGADLDTARTTYERAVLDSLSSVLAEPVEDVVLTMPDGRPCIETKTTRDLQDALAMPGGNIFHGPLSWPFAEDDEALTGAAARWGVTSAYDGVLLAGAGSRRGGGVSGLGGYHAARAILEARAD
ncbi:NAD(P)/FAD-dependent oxidoreductase [Allobranchiibius sp. CTAmp26]|uniref:phytoene desaturase family protein n=1 Tax=Allobranchiibius sp. CTAmp26 TaxID=2815214 RepID=UPI001AA12B85|nr:NAD(P)/FAD-dependent oxidoreductase [Allobranchiibius sp. CTAmp26]MBO1754735.1 NAD(P)/FAD-dependent oxidoreductase [Allobranchiibius sp. CTAmp26]